MQRQYSGTAGRTENCQIGTFLAYASQHGHALIDRELYLPASWTDDRDRCRAAGIDDEIEFATKPRQLMAMLARAFAAGVPFAWVTADEAYGQVKYLRVWLEEHDAAHVLALRCCDSLRSVEGAERRADDLIAELLTRAWRRLSVGAASVPGCARKGQPRDRVPRGPHRRPQGWLTFRELRELVQAAMRLEVPDDAQ